MPDTAAFVEFGWKVTVSAGTNIAQEIFLPMMCWIVGYIVGFSVVAFFVLRRLGVLSPRVIAAGLVDLNDRV